MNRYTVKLKGIVWLGQHDTSEETEHMFPRDITMHVDASNDSQALREAEIELVKTCHGTIEMITSYEIVLDEKLSFWHEHVEAVVAYLCHQEYTGEIGMLPVRIEDLDAVAKEIAAKVMKSKELEQFALTAARVRLTALTK
jgi:hypothetical protein